MSWRNLGLDDDARSVAPTIDNILVRAERIVPEHQSSQETQSAEVTAIAPKIGRNRQTREV